jgi:small-conductance mechanosensitive channel
MDDGTITGAFQNWWQTWGLFLGTLLLAVCVALVCHYLLARILLRLAKRSASSVDELLIEHFRRPVRWIMVAVAARLAIEPFELPNKTESFATTVFGILLVALVAWLLVRATYVLNDVVLLRFKVDVKDNLRARKIHTQLRVLRRLIIIVIVIVAAASILMTFPRIRQLGAAILASAGIIGIVVGFAAQKSIATFIAGLQIAFTQPIRLDDVVIVEGEWGRIEEITLTYVVVRIWDLRRLIVPITYFIETPFQNWTRVSADILGSVFLYVDHTVPIDAIRKELQRLLEETDLWDRKVCVLQVTNTTERTIEVRALMSAADASVAWDLRCHIREKLVEFMQKDYPEALPRLRAELDRLPSSRTLETDGA